MVTHRGGHLVKFLREQSKQTQSELAKKLKISQSYLSAIENGQKPSPSIEVLKKLADSLGFTMDEYFEGKRL